MKLPSTHWNLNHSSFREAMIDPCLPRCHSAPFIFLKYYKTDQIRLDCFTFSCCCALSKNGDNWYFLGAEDFFKNCNICQIRLWSAQCTSQYQCTYTSGDQVGKRSWERNQYQFSLMVLKRTHCFCKIRNRWRPLVSLQYICLWSASTSTHLWTTQLSCFYFLAPGAALR